MKIINLNLERCKAFRNSDYYNFLMKNQPDFIETIFTQICIDPDACDEVLYQKLGKKYNLVARKSYLSEVINGRRIKLSSDVICGRKQIVRLYDYDYDKWVLDYEKIRKNLDLHFIWPKHKAPTINTYRYNMYIDRIDCLLYDLKCHFKGEITPMNLAYIQEDTALWLNKFNNDFKKFIDTMKLNFLVDENYEVLDISKMQNETINKIFTLSEVKQTHSLYMECMLELNRTNQLKYQTP